MLSKGRFYNETAGLATNNKQIFKFLRGFVPKLTLDSLKPNKCFLLSFKILYYREKSHKRSYSVIKCWYQHLNKSRLSRKLLDYREKSHKRSYLRNQTLVSTSKKIEEGNDKSNK